MEVYKINGFKNFALLAFDYFPELKNIDAARKKCVNKSTQIYHSDQNWQ